MFESRHIFTFLSGQFSIKVSNEQLFAFGDLIIFSPALDYSYCVCVCGGGCFLLRSICSETSVVPGYSPLLVHEEAGLQSIKLVLALSFKVL